MRLRIMWLASVLLALVPAAGPADASVLVTVNKATQRMTVSVDGRPLYSWPVSTGMRGHATPAGTFRPFRMEEEHYSEEWDDAPMPHSIFFTAAGHAIHGSNATRHLGSPECDQAFRARQVRGDEQHQGGRDWRRAGSRYAASPGSATSSSRAIPVRLLRPRLR
jgi:hypothetical protein